MVWSIKIAPPAITIIIIPAILAILHVDERRLVDVCTVVPKGTAVVSSSAALASGMVLYPLVFWCFWKRFMVVPISLIRINEGGEGKKESRASVGTYYILMNKTTMFYKISCMCFYEQQETKSTCTCRATTSFRANQSIVRELLSRINQNRT